MRVTLWQRIFIYTVGLLILSHILSLFIHNALILSDLRHYFAASARAIAADLEGQPLQMVLRHARIYSHSQNRIWVTNADGSALPGSDFSAEPLMQRQRKSWEKEGVTLMESHRDLKLWAVVPVMLSEGPYSLYMSFGSPPRPLRKVFLLQLFASVLIVSCTMGLWMAWRVSRPLRKLRDEVREMSETGPECKVTAAGKDEINDVATAVNTMADSLARNVRGLRALVVNLSHELRSPLARANIALGILEESLPPAYVNPPDAPEGEAESPAAARKRLSARYLAALQEEMAHMETLIGTTLLTRKLEVESENVPMEPVDFSSLCENVWKRYKPMFVRSALVPSDAVTPGLTVSGNRTLLLQLLTNLLDNSLKYASRGGEVRFSLTGHSGKCALRVENSHEGISEADLDHIFDPFYRVDQATGTGVGLGLALVRKTVWLHGGEVKAEPTGIGLCICLQLPLADSREV